VRCAKSNRRKVRAGCRTPSLSSICTPKARYQISKTAVRMQNLRASARHTHCGYVGGKNDAGHPSAPGVTITPRIADYTRNRVPVPLQHWSAIAASTER
jgi:hypothetical protein